jgi:hypothetical protein
MPSDFTVIEPVRQRFGDDDIREGEDLVEQEAPFVGKSKDFPFSCPNVASGEMGVLQFESIAVTAGRGDSPRNILRINGVDIPGGITPGPLLDDHLPSGLPLWKSHSLIVPANVLQEQNVLHIESILLPEDPFGTQIDNFIIDNIVVFFKTRAQGPRPVQPEFLGMETR